jgi:cell division protein FtsQ
MAKKSKTSYAAKTNRLRRRIANGLIELIGSMGLIVIVAVFTMIFIYGYGCFLSLPYFEIKEISVRGIKELTEKDILSIAEIKPSQNLLAVNTDAVMRRVSANPWVKNIYVGKELPNRLVLEVQERNAVALVKKAGDFYLMDSEGATFKKLGKGDEVDLPILTGLNGDEKNRSKILTNALALMKVLANSAQYSYLGTISEVHADEVFGLSLLTDAGLYLKLGQDGYEDKLMRLNAVMSDIDKRGLKRNFLSIDLCDTTKITIHQKNPQEGVTQGKKGRQYRT